MIIDIPSVKTYYVNMDNKPERKQQTEKLLSGLNFTNYERYPAKTGQNAIEQAKQFTAVTEVTGIVLTKLDGTAKGGVVLAIANQFNIPVRYIGVGEKIEDIQVFNPKTFVDSLLGE